jgi:hypothetical protein
MATPKIKATYSLDEPTIRALEQIARRWNTSKSEAVRLSILAALQRELGVHPVEEPLAALDALQRSLRLNEDSAQKWQKEAKDERRRSFSSPELSERS